MVGFPPGSLDSSASGHSPASVNKPIDVVIGTDDKGFSARIFVKKIQKKFIFEDIFVARFALGTANSTLSATQCDSKWHPKRDQYS